MAANCKLRLKCGALLGPVTTFQSESIQITLRYSTHIHNINSAVFKHEFLGASRSYFFPPPSPSSNPP